MVAITLVDNIVHVLRVGDAGKTGLRARRGRSGPGGLDWLPVPLFVGAIVALAVFPIDLVWLPPVALSVPNMVFLFAIMFLVSILAAMSYQTKKSGAILLMGCGALAYGLAGLLGGLFYPQVGAATDVATYNAAAFLAALCFTGSAVYGLSAGRAPRQHVWPALLASYLGVAALITFAVVLIASGRLPISFVEGAGATAFGLGTEWVAAVLFGIAAVLMIQGARGEPSFHRWYSLGLGLIAVGLVGVSLQRSLGDPLNWAGRSAQYLGSVYLLIASVLSIRQTGEWKLPLERALRESEERLRRISSAGGIGLFEWDVGRNRAYWSPEAYELFGSEPGSPVTYQRWSARVHPDDRDRFARYVAALGERGGKESPGVTHKIEYRALRADGTVRWLETTTACDREGGDLIMRGTVQDITERRRAEEDMKAQRQLFETIVQDHPSGVLILRGRDMQIIHINEVYQSFAPGKAMVGRTVPEVWPMMPGLEDTFRHVLATGRPVNQVDAPFTLQRSPDGLPEQAYFSWSLRRIRLPGDDGWGVLNTALETTEHKKAEEALEEAKAQAELYVDLMGHDINNMHQIALGYLELAMDHIRVEGPQKEYLEKPVAVLQRSSRLIRNVQKLQRSRSGGYRPEVLDLGALIEDVSSHYKDVPGRHANVTAGTVRGVMVEANELLADVFENLIDNAIKHSVGPASIEVRMSVEGQDGRGRCVVSVEDHGTGVPDEAKGRIFERLQRGDTRAQGSGLGLYLVRSLVEGYGGRVWVEDRIKGDHTKGARFLITLPTVKNVAGTQPLPEQSVQKA